MIIKKWAISQYWKKKTEYANSNSSVGKVLVREESQFFWSYRFDPYLNAEICEFRKITLDQSFFCVCNETNQFECERSSITMKIHDFISIFAQTFFNIQQVTSDICHKWWNSILSFFSSQKALKIVSWKFSSFFPSSFIRITFIGPIWFLICV